MKDDEIYLAKQKLKGSFLLGNQSLDEILQRKIQLISNGLSPISEVNFNTKMEEVTSLDILNLTNKYFSKPFLSISGIKIYVWKLKISGAKTFKLDLLDFIDIN